MSYMSRVMRNEEKPPFAARFLLMALVMSFPPALAGLYVLPRYGIETAMWVGFTTGTLAVFLITYLIGWLRWHD